MLRPIWPKNDKSGPLFGPPNRLEMADFQVKKGAILGSRRAQNKMVILKKHHAMLHPIRP